MQSAYILSYVLHMYIPYSKETWPGEQTIHLSTCLGSNCVTQMATRSPYIYVHNKIKFYPCTLNVIQ